jgi:methionyl-tRNA formyltransferase
MVVAAYGLILPQWVLTLPARGCLNIHASLLPRWRGAAPIHRAIEAGDAQTGVTIMQMDAGLDTGDMLLAQALPIAPDDTTGTLHDKLAALGGQLVVQALQRAAAGELQRTPQPAEGVTYAHKIDKAEARIDWSRPAQEIARAIRAFNPAPGAFSQLGDDLVKLWRCEIDSKQSSVDGGCGTILLANSDGVQVACGSGVLRLTELQRAGGKRLSAAEFLRGHDIKAGMMFETAAP